MFPIGSIVSFPYTKDFIIYGIIVKKLCNNMYKVRFIKLYLGSEEEGDVGNIQHCMIFLAGLEMHHV